MVHSCQPQWLMVVSLHALQAINCNGVKVVILMVHRWSVVGGPGRDAGRF